MIRPLRTAGIQGRGHLVRLSVFLVLLGALALVVTGAPRVLADSAAVRVDRQAYIADTVVDPYSQDPNNVHVGVAGGKESARGFLHIDLSRLPQGSSLSSMLVTLVPSSSNTDNLNPSAASLSACILTKELPATFDRGNPPPFDCLRSQVNGHATAQGSWQFDLAPMASTWMQSGNTGAAIVPNAAAGAVGPPVPAVEQDWALSFTKTASTAVLIFAPLTTAPAGETQFGPSTNGPVLAPLAIPEMAPPVVAPTPPANTQPAPLPRPAAHPSRRLTSGSTANWLFIAIACLGLLALVVGVATAVQARVTLLTLPGVSGLEMAFRRARSNVATPVAVLAVAAIVALGFGPTSIAGGGQQSDGLGTSGAVGQEQAGTGGASPLASATASGNGVTGGTGALLPTGATGASGHGSGAVTATDLNLGYMGLGGGSAAFAAAGVNGLVFGDDKAAGKAIGDYLNAHGGIAHRHVHLVYFEYNTADGGNSATDAAERQNACTSFTQDNHVFAVLDYSGDLATCLHQSGTSEIVDVPYYTADYYKTFAGYAYMPSSFIFDRFAQTYVDQMWDAGFFSTPSRAKVGLLVGGSDAYSQNLVARIIKPALAAHGLNVSDNDINYGYATGTNWPAVELRFAADSVSHILSFGVSPLFFMEAADQQKASFRYALSSDLGPALLQGTWPASQIHNALALGWDPYRDVDAAHDPGPLNSNQVLCRQIMHNAGQDTTSRTAQETQQDFCDDFFFLKAVLEQSSDISPTAMWSAAGRMAHSYASPVTFATAFSPNVPDGASAVRIDTYDDSCTCFRYTSPLISIR